MTLPSENERAETGWRSVKDRLAFEDLFFQNWGRVFGVLFRLTGDRAEAEDLALETFWRLWQRPPEQEQSLGGWLYRVATNLGYNALRAAGRRQHYEQSAGRDAFDLSESPNPAGEVERNEARQRVRQVLSRMPARQAQLLILRHSGLSYQEIAEALHLSPSSVGTLLGRAEKEFVQQYDSGGDHASDG
jgi:RNA polymerase sigma-70 factor (ECF subfamily)